MKIQQFRALTADAKIETLFQRSEEAIVDISVLRREIKYVKTQLFYLKNKFKDLKKETAQCESSSSKTKSKKALTSSL